MLLPETSARPLLDLDALPVPACLFDASGGLAIAHNARFAEWLGEAEVAGRGLDDLFGGDPSFGRILDEAASRGEAAPHCVARSGRDGRQTFWSLRAQHTPAGVLLWADDVTAVAEASRAVQASQRDFVAATAHELRGPLASIKAWASAAAPHRSTLAGDPLRGPLATRSGDPRSAPLAKRAGDPLRRAGAQRAEAQELVGDALDAIVRQVDRMNELLGDLLDVARSDGGALRASRAPIAVEELVRRALTASPHAERAAPGPLPGVVEVDALHLEAVIVKLLGFVARRQVDGPISIGAREEPGEVHLTVVDRGPPLPRAAQGDMFCRFGRPGRRQGAGLGLYISQQLVAASGGRLWLEPADAGARFVIALPARARAHASIRPPSSSHPSIPPLRPVRLLVADADATLVARTVDVLRLQGHDVEGASSAEAFWARLDQREFDVVVVDLLMKGIGGVPAVEQIRATPTPPAVVVTAPSLERPDALAGAERAGAQAVLPKPLDLPHLLALVQNAAAARASAAA